MLMDIRHKLEDSAVQELIGLTMFSDSAIENTIESYKHDAEQEIMGYFLDEELIALIGYQMDEKRVLEIKHIAVVPEEQGHGYGRGIILEILNLKSPKTITVETDEDAIDFYRSIGFRIESLGEKYPGVERFMCTYQAEE